MNDAKASGGVCPIPPRDWHTPALKGGSPQPLDSWALDRRAMDPEASVNVESPVKFLLLRTEIPCRLGHRNDLRLIDSVGSPVSHDRRLPAGENVLHPIGALAIRDGDQKAVIMLNRHDGGLVGPTRTAAHMADDRGGGLLRPCGSHSKWPCRLRKSAQGSLDGSFDSRRVPRPARPDEVTPNEDRPPRSVHG